MAKSIAFQFKSEITETTSNTFNIKAFTNLKIRIRKNKQ